MTVSKEAIQEQALSNMAGKEPWRDGYHLGLPDTNIAIELEYGRFLKELVISKRPKNIVEVGTGQGYSTAWMLLGVNHNKFGSIYTFDNTVRRPYVWDKADISAERLCLFNTEFKDALEFMPREIDLVFHDAAHRIEMIREDLELLLPRMRVGGMILVHDTNYCREMGDMLKVDFEARPAWRYEERKEACGLGIAEKIGEDSE